MTPTCPVDGCSKPRKDNQLMCKSHWFMVPKDLRDEVWSLAKKMWADLNDEEAYQNWRDAADAAIGEVELREKEDA